MHATPARAAASSETAGRTIMIAARTVDSEPRPRILTSVLSRDHLETSTAKVPESAPARRPQLISRRRIAVSESTTRLTRGTRRSPMRDHLVFGGVLHVCPRVSPARLADRTVPDWFLGRVTTAEVDDNGRREPVPVCWGSRPTTIDPTRHESGGQAG